MKTFKIILSAGWYTKDYCTGLTEQEAIDICESSGWERREDDDFIWCMNYVEE